MSREPQKESALLAPALGILTAIALVMVAVVMMGWIVGG